MMSGKHLYTVGYEGADLNDFIATLKAFGIKQIIDVRDLPLSRKRGFSKNALAQALAKAGVKYLHLKSLGDPKPGREAARSGNLARFRQIYGRHLETTDAQTGLMTAAHAARKTTSSLLCYERDHADCHRSIVADRLGSDFKIQHIVVAPPATRSRKVAIEPTSPLALG